MKPTILCVDDEVDNLDALERVFRSKFTVLRATSGSDALKILDQHPGVIEVILTDQRMPAMTGSQFLEASMQSHPDSIRILLTGYTDIASIIEAVNSGQIYRYLNKPWDPTDLVSTVDRAVERFHLRQELQTKNQKLAEALTELQSLDQAKNQFMILINHELKTPLTSIINFTDLLKETRLSEEQDVCVRRIEKSTERLRSLIEDVLLVVQGETGLLKSKIAPFIFQDLKLDLPLEIQNLANQKNLKVIFRWPENKVIADQQLLQQVLVRLLHNAVKFASEKSQIIVAAEQIKAHRLRFRVFNQGPLVPVQVIDKIIKPFFIDENVMHHSVGMGLGLSICQSILKSQGSQIEIQNEKDGVEISFELPSL